MENKKFLNINSINILEISLNLIINIIKIIYFLKQ